MDLFAPLFGVLLVALLLVDHSILNAKIEKLGKELKRYEQRYPDELVCLSLPGYLVLGGRIYHDSLCTDCTGQL